MTDTKDLKIGEIIRQNRELGRSIEGRPFPILLLSNVIVNSLKDILEFELRSSGVPAEIHVGGYDTLLQDAVRASEFRAVVVFSEIANFRPGFLSGFENYSPELQASMAAQASEDLKLLLQRLKAAPLVLFNRFSTRLFAVPSLRENPLQKLCSILNAQLDAVDPSNLIVADIDQILASLSVEKSADRRFWFSSTAPYSVAFMKEYAQFVAPAFRALAGKSKKALVLDCDNTLWKGIVGEDGPNGIELSNSTPHGRIFQEVQSTALALEKRGVILCLCSKNNPQDVAEIVHSHPHHLLREQHLTIQKVNWEEKTKNIREIASELNIALESIVFVDDSEYELHRVAEALPQVTRLLVPKNLEEYPAAFRRLGDLFFSLQESREDLERSEMLRQNQVREREQSAFTDTRDYLRSLELKVEIVEDSVASIPRLAQLTQKTNQFNLTTRRYSENDLRSFLASGKWMHFEASVRDRFGDYGLTALCLVSIENDGETARIDTFLMSCRIIGREIEWAFLGSVLNSLKKKGIKAVSASYFRTEKNAQTQDFFDRARFEVIRESEAERHYRLPLDGWEYRTVENVEVYCGKAN